MERLFKDWLDNPLARLGRQPNLVVERHDKITKENGPLDCQWSYAQSAGRLQPRLPAANPVSAIDWNKEHRRNTGMGPLKDEGFQIFLDQNLPFELRPR